MKFHETTFDEYLSRADAYDLHPELSALYADFPDSLRASGNVILYGPGGSGKYTQALRILRRLSPTSLKHTAHITVVTDKMSYTYAMSDVHYEVDMALLGCNSKMMWSEIFLQITDMVSVKPEKRGVIVCKNFHMIHNELLDVFYSYMQKRRAPLAGVSFMLLTEHLGFVPDDIADSSYVVSVPRPSRERMEEMCVRNLARNEKEVRARVARIMCELEPEHIVNLKEIYAFASMESASEIPKDVFNIVCDNIINLMRGAHSLALPAFRDAVYDILVYNLDVSECVWYVLCYFVRSGQLASARKMTEITRSFAPFLKYRNNNYREIFHLERIFVLIATVAFDIC